MLEEPKVWVAASFILFVALAYKKVGALIIRALDNRSAKISEELTKARALREEAEKVLAAYKQKQAQCLKEAGEMMSKAQSDAKELTAQAERNLKDMLQSRTQQALDKISREEEQAIQDVRNHVVDVALAAARTIIVDHVSTMSQDELVKLALSDMERKVH